VSGAAPAPLELAGAALAHAAGEALVRVECERGRRVGGGPWEDTTVEVLAIREGHTATARTTRTDGDGLREAVLAAERTAEDFARRSDEPGPYPGLPEPVPCRAHQGFDLATAALREADLQVIARTAVAEAGGGEAQVDAAAAEIRTGLASTRGHELSDARTAAELRVAVAGRGRAARHAPALAALDPAPLAQRAAANAPAAGALQSLPDGEYPVVLEAEALAELLDPAAAVLFTGLGPLRGALGRRVAASTVNLSDSPRFPGTLPCAFDAEGVPKAPLPLIQDGVAHRLVHDVRSAALAGGGARSTGHARAPGGEPGPAPGNLVLVGGGAEDAAELAASVALGLHVDHLEEVVVDGDPPIVVARARGGARVIRDGALVAPLDAVRLEIPALELLARVEALGRQLNCWLAAVCPPVRLGTVAITQGA
jgi:predicted Zn-dependent protease